VWLTGGGKVELFLKQLRCMGLGCMLCITGPLTHKGIENEEGFEVLKKGLAYAGVLPLLAVPSKAKQ